MVIMDVILVCHTEFGYSKNKKPVYDKDHFEGVTAGVPNLVKVADEAGARVTFGVMPEVINFFPEGIKHEIGLHLHPGWQELQENGMKFFVGDQYIQNNCMIDNKSTALIDHGFRDQLCMVKAGKDRIIDAFGVEPKVFVAGRWSLNNDTVKALVQCNFTHDCSAQATKRTDHFDWHKLGRICMPYNPDVNDYQSKGDSPLLIMPVSQTMMGASVTPENVPSIGLSWLKACFLEYYGMGVPFFHIYLHSPVMTDPYFISALRDLLKFIGKYDVKFKFASEIKKYDLKAYNTNVAPYLSAINFKLIKNGIKQKILDR
jgi:hypothetical protein